MADSGAAAANQNNAAALVKIRSNLTGAKEARKRSELDAQLLANHRQMIEQGARLREAIAYWLDSASPTNESETGLSS